MPSIARVLVCVVLAHWAWEHLPANPTKSWRTVCGALETLADSGGKAEKREATRAVLFRVMREKERLVEEVLAGRVPLREAGRRYREISLALPDPNWPRVRKMIGGESEEEFWCRALVMRVRSTLADTGRTDTAGVLPRLEAGLRELRGPACGARRPPGQVFVRK